MFCKFQQTIDCKCIAIQQESFNKVLQISVSENNIVMFAKVRNKVVVHSVYPYSYRSLPILACALQLSSCSLYSLCLCSLDIYVLAQSLTVNTRKQQVFSKKVTISKNSFAALVLSVSVISRVECADLYQLVLFGF